MKVNLNYVLLVVIFGMLTWIIIDDMKDDERNKAYEQRISQLENKRTTTTVYRTPLYYNSLYSPWYYPTRYWWYPYHTRYYRYGSYPNHGYLHKEDPEPEPTPEPTL